MKYSKAVYEKAKAEIDSRRSKAETQAAERHDAFAKLHPELLWIENEMAKTGLAAVHEVLNGKNAEHAIQNLAKRNLSLQADRAKLLKTCRLPEHYLQPDYTCKLCSDTGYADGKMCACQQQLLQQFACEALSFNLSLQASRFDNFDLTLYPTQKNKSGVSPRACMQDIYQYCKDYANDFSPTSGNLFMCGETGLGKTHLSLAIAGEVIKKGYTVIYDSAQTLLSRLERERFGGFKTENPVENAVLNCDLLILDDLGAEFATKFTVAEIYNIINTRIMSGKPTVISTNYSDKDLEKQYSNRVVSRIIGNYDLLLFCGNDIRQIKKNS